MAEIKKIAFNKKLHQKLKKRCKGHLIYYFPILTVLNQCFKKLKGKKVLEVGYRNPLFLNYLKSKGVDAFGIDIKPEIIGKNQFKMSIEKITPSFKKKFKNYFDIIVERITLSRLYNRNYFLKKGKHRFKNRKLILSNISKLLKKEGMLILQDDRGSIFTKKEFKQTGFKKIMKEIKIVFNKKGKYLGWNTLVVYKKA